MCEDSLEKYYRARAREYEWIYYRDDPARQSELDDEADRLARLVEGKTVLELACGTGYWTRVMSLTASGIVASDVAPEMLTEARKKEYQCSVSFVQADMYESPFGRECFDLVALGFWFSHQPRQDYEQLFQALVRPLKKDGLIWMVDNNPAAEWPLETSHRQDAYGNNYKQRTLSDGQSYVVLKNYFSQAELEEILATRFEIRSLVYGQCYWSAVLAG